MIEIENAVRSGRPLRMEKGGVRFMMSYTGDDSYTIHDSFTYYGEGSAVRYTSFNCAVEFWERIDGETVSRVDDLRDKG